jgi:RNA polymerase sigma factor (sigma-70 family)
MDSSGRRRDPRFEDLLDRSRASLAQFFSRRAVNLLRYESIEDLVQGACVKALDAAAQFEVRGDEEFHRWVLLVAKQHAADRHRYWTALRRRAGKAVRYAVSTASQSESQELREFAASQSGPATRAGRREEIDLATKALTALFPRDHAILQSVLDDEPVESLASRLGLGYEAAKKARQRALERLVLTIRVLRARGTPGSHPSRG